MLVKCQKAYGNNTGQAPNRSFANSNYAQKIPHIQERLKFEILKPMWWCSQLVQEDSY